MYKRIIIAAAAAASICSLRAQVNSPDPDGFITRARMMYADGNYHGCIDQLSALRPQQLTPSQYIEIEYYRAAATVYIDRTEAIRLLDGFITRNPQSALVPKAKMMMGMCFYGSDYTSALTIFDQIDPRTLEPVDAEDLIYHKACCLLQTGLYSEAAALFERLTACPRYAETALFYTGYISYINQDYPGALAIFKRVNSDKAPANMADFYIAQIYYVKGDYAQALSAAKVLLRRPGISAEYEGEANRIAGEAAYSLGQQSQAVQYLRKYIDTTESPMPSALYILGLDAYDAGDYENAITYLADAATEENAMGQSANLYMGQAYLHEKEYTSAAMAFNRALHMDYDPAVREAAYYNYAVASGMGGKVPFASTVNIFSDFLRLYPSSRRAPQVQKHIINSYLTDSDYSAALASIEKMKNPTPETLAAKQKVLYSLGVQALAASHPKEALDYLNQARKLAKYDKSTDLEVALALGEAFNAIGEYGKAAVEIQKYLNGSKASAPNLSLGRYDLAYALFSQKKYSQAAPLFEKVVSAPGPLPASAVADAYNRLADCQYAQKDFEKALASYKKAFNTDPGAGDYALFQQALMSGFLRDHSAKIAELDKMRSAFPSSALIPDALLETTEAYLQLGKSDKAIATYRRLVSDYPSTAQARQGYLQMALVKLNSGDRRGAVADYRTIVRDYPASEEAAEAVAQLKRISADDGTLSDLAEFLSTTTGAPQINENEMQRLSFETAEREYITKGETTRLETYLNEYPHASNRDQAMAYLIEGYLNEGDTQIAYDYACALTENYPSSPFAQKALADKATIEEQKGKGNLALRTWKQLVSTASSPAVLLSARMGVMRNAREAEKFDDVLEAADAILASSGAGYDQRAEAAFSRGEALMAKNKKKEARAAWMTVAESTYNLYGIRSALSLARSLLDDNDLAGAEKWAKHVANSDSPHAYWVARGFIVLSDVYTARGEKQKARQYLQALRDNYTETDDDIQALIDERLK